MLYTSDDQSVVPQTDIDSVLFTVMKPNDPAGTPTISAASGQVVGDGHGQFVVPAATNDTPGHYRAIATFVYDDDQIIGLTKSIPCNYEITDPFDTTGSSPADPYIDQTWTKLEDCFDSDLGGPWLRDMTLSVFDKYKLRKLLPEVFLAINQQMPFTSYNEQSFPYSENDGGALVAQGLLVATLRHLMRSYAEQPDITNSPVAFENRQRYQQTWGTVYALELAEFEKWLNRWKLRAYEITHSSVLIGSKAGRNLAGAWRSRGIVRGW